jgi:hypothetical protein
MRLRKSKRVTKMNFGSTENFLGCKVKTVKPIVIKFRDQQIQENYDKTIACVSGCPVEQLPILAMLDALYWFQLIEGEQSPKVKELLEKLLSPELRPALRAWYQRSGDKINDGALKFRKQISALAGENFGFAA